MIHASLARPDQIRHNEVVAGRALHIRLEISPPADLLGVYQVAWNPNHTSLQGSATDRTQALLARRMQVWRTIHHWISGVPQRNQLLLLGDFNCTLMPQPPHVGTGVTDTSTAPHQDADEFQRIVCQHGLTALNTWSRGGRAASTFLRPAGVGAQLDYAITRLPCHPSNLQTKGQSDASIVHPTGFRHIPLIGSITRSKPPRNPPRSPVLQASQAQRMLRADPHLASTFHTAVAEQVHAESDLNSALLHAWYTTTPPALPPTSGEHNRHLQHPRLDGATQATLKQFWNAKRALRQALDDTDHYSGPVILHVAECGMSAVRNSFPRATLGLRSWVRAWQSAVRFHHLDKQFRKASRAKKLQQLESLLQEAQDSTEQGVLGLYRIIHRFKPKTSRRTIHFRDQDGRLMSAKDELLQLKSYFGSLFHAPDRTTHPVWTLHEGLWPTLGEVTSALASLPSNKALPSGHAPAVLWRQNVDSLAPVVTQQLQRALGPGQLCFPESWHLSYMVLIPKEGKPPTAPQHLRPICLLPAMSKITARILAGRLRPYLEQALHRVPQFAYLRSRQTNDALDKVLSHCHQIRQQLGSYRNSIFDKRAGVQHRHFCGGLQVSLDLSKAFDRIPRARLYQALVRVGAPSDLASAIMYVHDSASIVLERHGLYETVPLASGIRQGCGLSPLLWLAFTLILYDDLLPICPADAITCFADDFHVQWNLAHPRDFRNACQQILRIFEVFENHGMTIATDKTVVLMAMKGPEVPKLLQEFVQRRGPDRLLVLPRTVGSLLIPIKTSHKYLGVHIGYGKFERVTLTARLRLSWIAFGRLRTFLKHPGLPVTRRLSLWRTYVWAILQYGLTSVGLDAWSVDKLRSQVAKQIRLVVRSPAHVSHETTAQLFARLKIPDPMTTLAEACKRRITVSAQALHHLQPEQVKHWWALLESTFSIASPTDQSEAVAPRVRLREITQVANFRCACPECGQYFPTSHALSVHIGKQHAAIRPRKARNTREKQVRCEEYRQHSERGMPQCRHCHRQFYGWLQFRGHFSQQACPVLHYQEHALDRRTPQHLTSPDPSIHPTSTMASRPTQAVAFPAQGASAPGDCNANSTPRPPEVPLFDRSEFQQLARRNTVKALAKAIRESATLQHCPICYQWMAKSSYVSRHACSMHSAVSAAQPLVAAWAQSKPPPLCPCNWCGIRFRGPATVHRKSCVVLWMCGHFLHRFDSLSDPGQTSLHGFCRQEQPGAQGGGDGAGALCGVHASPNGGAVDGAEQRKSLERECRTDPGSGLGAPQDGRGPGETPRRSPARASHDQVAQRPRQRRQQGRGPDGGAGAGQDPGARRHGQRPRTLASQSLAAAFRAGASGVARTPGPTAATELVGPTAAPLARPQRAGDTPELVRPRPGLRSRDSSPSRVGGCDGTSDAEDRGQHQRLQSRHQLHAVSSDEGVGERLDGDQGALHCREGVEPPEIRECRGPQPTDADCALSLPPLRFEDAPSQHGVGHRDVPQGQGNGPDRRDALPLLEMEPARPPLRARCTGTIGSREGGGDRGLSGPTHLLPGHDRQVPPAPEAHPNNGERGDSLLAPHSESHSGGTPDVLPHEAFVSQRLPTLGGSHGPSHSPGPEPPGCTRRPAPAVDQWAVRPEETQIASLVLHNPSSHCYANSVVVALLWLAGHLPHGLRVRRDFSRFLQWLLRKPLHVALWHTRAWTVLMQGWISPCRQHDAADYLHFLRPLLHPSAYEGVWESRVEGSELYGPSAVQVADHGHVWPLHLSVVNASAQPSSLQKLFIDWRNQAQRHALVTAPTALVVQVGRFNDRGEKVRFRLRSSRTVYIPTYSQSGLQTTSHAYEVLAIVFHLGRSRACGHYRAAFLQQGQLSWLTDDDVPPTAIRAPEIVEVESNAYLYFLAKRTESD